MKNIALIVYNISYEGGLNQVVVNVANAFADKYNIHIVSLAYDGHIDYKLDERIKVTWLSEKLERISLMRRHLKNKLRDYIIQNDIQLAIIEGDYPGFIASTLRYTTKAKLIFHEHGTISGIWDRKDIIFIRFIASLFSHKTVVLTERNRRDYIKKLFIRKNKVVVIPNWVEKDESIRNVYNAASKKIIYAGRISKEKGCDLLVEAFSLIEKDNTDWQLDMYGDGLLVDDIKRLINEKGLDGRVNLMGWSENLESQFGEYSFLVLTSKTEGFPLILLQAQNAGLPIISFDIYTGPREIVNDGVDGFLIKPYEVEDFAQAMQLLINDRDLRIKMSKNTEKSRTKYTKEKIMQIWKKTFDELI